MHLANLLSRAARRYPHVDALVEKGRRLSYAEWNRRVNSVANGLRRMGVRPGERVALCAANSESYATLFFAVQKVEAVAVPLSTRWKSTELAYAIADAEVQAIAYDQRTSSAVEEALCLVQCKVRRIFVGQTHVAPLGAVHIDELASCPSCEPGPVRRDPRDVASILYTSGTMGRPKGVMRTHQSDYAGLTAMLLAHDWTWHERTLVVMPFFHVMGLHTLLGIIALNGTCVIEPEFDPERTRDLIHHEDLTALYLVPTAYHDLVDNIAQRGGLGRRVPKLAYAGAPMSPHLVRRCLELFDPEIMVNHYGSTEMQIITANRIAHLKPGSAGRPGLNTELRVVVADRARQVGPDEVVSPGTVGEVIVSANSPQAFSGYLNRPDCEASVLRQGWYFTGDLGMVDADGDLTLLGRVDDMIVSGGENIHPCEVEEVLIGHPGVRDVVVTGWPDERWGQVVAAFIVRARHDLDARELDQHCLEHSALARFKRPRRYIFVDAIPRSPSGKVLVAQLRSEFGTP